MAATIIDGKALAAKKKAQVAEQTAKLRSRPGLAVILVGDDPASRVYVTSKRRDCEECGFYSEEFALPAATGQKALLELVDTLNERPEIDGILCQLPLPKGYDYDEQEVLLHIDPSKDVDAFHPANVGKIMIGDYDFLPCTPAGVMEMLEEYHIDPAGKHCVVVGRSEYRRKTPGYAAAAQARHSDDLSLQDPRSGGCYPSGGHSGGRRRPGESHHCRHGQTRCSGH